MGCAERRRVDCSHGRWARDVPRVTRVGLVTPFADDLVCILDTLARVSGGTRAMARTEEGRGKGGFGWLTEGSPSRLARLPLGATPSLRCRCRDCLGVCRVLKWTNRNLLDFLPLFSNFGFSNRRWSGFPDFRTRLFRVLVEVGPLRKVIKRRGCRVSLPATMTSWLVDRTPSPRSDMDTDADDSDDRDPSPYSDDDSGPLWVKTPLIRSPHTSARLGLNAYLKMEVMQWTTSPLRVWLT